MRVLGKVVEVRAATFTIHRQLFCLPCKPPMLSSGVGDDNVASCLEKTETCLSEHLCLLLLVWPFSQIKLPYTLHGLCRYIQNP